MAIVHKGLVALLALSLLLSVSPAAVLHAQDAQRITVDELRVHARQARCRGARRPCRQGLEFEQRQDSGAVREEPMKAASWALRYPKEKTYVLYCA